MNFHEKLDRAITTANSLVCVGLDQAEFELNKRIVDATADLVCAYKPNLAFYEALGAQGWLQLEKIIRYIREVNASIPIIADAKRGDIDNTNKGYVKAIFDDLSCDAITVNPYLGGEALLPFLERSDKGVIVLCRTSNVGSGELQDLVVNDKPLWQIVAEKVSKDWNTRGNCLLVVGATYPDELKRVREVVGEMTLLVPGIGAQGGDVHAAVTNGVNSVGRGMIINSSRAIASSQNPRQTCTDLRDAINASLPK